MLRKDELRAMREAVAARHRAWERSPGTLRDLHARNAAVLPGTGMRQPVDAAVCRTDGAQVSGGTGMAIRLARHHAIPVLNLADTDPDRAMRRLDGIAASVAARLARKKPGSVGARRPGPRRRARSTAWAGGAPCASRLR